MLEHDGAEIAQVEGRKIEVQRTEEVLVKPLCLFDLEQNPFRPR